MMELYLLIARGLYSASGMCKSAQVCEKPT